MISTAYQGIGKGESKTMPEIAINFSKSAFTVTGPSDALSKTTRTGEYNEKTTPGKAETLGRVIS